MKLLAGNANRPLAEAIAAYFNGDYDRAVDGFLATREDWSEVGGSHAQRDLYAQALLDAAIKAGRKHLAASLLGERAELHPTSRGVPYWRGQFAA